MPDPSMQPDMNWCAVLEHHAARRPDHPMIRFGEESVTYGEMAERVSLSAAGLRARGVGKGDIVALLSYNCIEFIETIFAANHLGAIAMPINWRLAAPEVGYILEHSGARPWSVTLTSSYSARKLPMGCTRWSRASASLPRPSTVGSHSAPSGATARLDLMSRSMVTTFTVSCTPRARPVDPRA